jgi:hypothetical protein
MLTFDPHHRASRLALRRRYPVRIRGRQSRTVVVVARAFAVIENHSVMVTLGPPRKLKGWTNVERGTSIRFRPRAQEI